MKTGFKIATVILLTITIIFFIILMQDGNYPYDQHGYYTGPNGVLYRESESEMKFFRFLFFLILPFVTAFLGLRKSRVRPQLK